MAEISKWCSEEWFSREWKKMDEEVSKFESKNLVDKVNMSYWLPKILREDSENPYRFYPERQLDAFVSVPETRIIPIPNEIFKVSLFPDIDNDKIYSFFKDEIYPIYSEMRQKYRVFMKNGNFSNKFYFKDACPDETIFGLIANWLHLTYMAAMVDAGGWNELVFREMITEKSYGSVPTIYHGMPLRAEFRVFYDFDEHKVLYSAEYWDWKYCHKFIDHYPTDRMVYNSYYNFINDDFLMNNDLVKEAVSNSLKKVTDLSGVWSVDLMLEKYHDEDGKRESRFWLIDMAPAQTSAYWDPSLIEE